MKYQHLNIEEREAIRVGLALGRSHRQIGESLGRSHTTISREIKRNWIKQNPSKLESGEYVACRAQVKAQKRASAQRRKAPLKCLEIFLYVREHLRLGWSPEQIAGRLSVKTPGLSIHHETIYRYIYSKPVRSRYKLYECLKLKRPKRREKTGRSVNRKKSSIPGAVSIDLRPDQVEEREQFGHFEIDLMEGPRSSKMAMSATVERKTRYTSLNRVQDHTANQKTASLVDGLSWLPKKFIRSLTADNGKENTQHNKWSTQFNAPVYFCHPYHSWEKGSVENAIGRVRWHIPKGTPLTQITDQQLRDIQHWLNHTPRKCLSWRTPHEALQEELNQLKKKKK